MGYRKAIGSRSNKAGGVITSGSPISVGCTGIPPKIWWLEEFIVPQKVALFIVDSPRPLALCPKHKNKMLNLGLFYFPYCVAYDRELNVRRMAMEQTWQTYPAQRYVVGIGKNHRDYTTLLKASAPLGLKVRILSGGNAVPGCSKVTHCEVMPFIPQEEFQQLISDAAFVVIPLSYDRDRKQWKMRTVVGSTAMQVSVMNGKVVVMTDLGVHLHDELVSNSSNGFLVRPGDVAGWTSVMTHLLQCKPAQLRAYMNESFNLAAAFTKESVIRKFTQKLLPLL